MRTEETRCFPKCSSNSPTAITSSWICFHHLSGIV